MPSSACTCTAIAKPSSAVSTRSMRPASRRASAGGGSGRCVGAVVVSLVRPGTRAGGSRRRCRRCGCRARRRPRWTAGCRRRACRRGTRSARRPGRWRRTRRRRPWRRRCRPGGPGRRRRPRPARRRRRSAGTARARSGTVGRSMSPSDDADDQGERGDHRLASTPGRAWRSAACTGRCAGRSSDRLSRSKLKPMPSALASVW